MRQSMQVTIATWRDGSALSGGIERLIVMIGG
jgi:hypothetical protein